MVTSIILFAFAPHEPLPFLSALFARTCRHLLARAELLALLGPYGKADFDERDGDPSFHFSADDVAANAYLVDGGAGDTDCLVFARPRISEALRQLAFLILDQLGGFVFDGELGCIYHVHGSAADLPATLRGGCSGMLCHVVAAQQLWPELHAPPESHDRPVLLESDESGVLPLQGALLALLGKDSMYRYALQVEPELTEKRETATASDLMTRQTAAEPESSQRTPEQQAYHERRMLQLAPALVYAFVCGAEQSGDRKEQQALFSEMYTLAQMDNAYGVLLKEALPNIMNQRGAYLEDPWRSFMEEDVDNPLQTLEVALRESCSYIDARHDEMQARYVRRRLYNLSVVIASASGGGFLRSAVSRDEQVRLDQLKKVLCY